MISIVIPVKNGKKLLQQCIESVLAQRFTDYEILVLTDSTTNHDGTVDYLHLLRLPNLKVIESPKQIGIQENWERILHLPKREFFTILGYDDLLYPGYLETIVKLINEYPDASLYQTHFDFIDEGGHVFGTSPRMDQKANGPAYLNHILQSNYPVTATGYVMRSADYSAVGGVPVKYPNLLYADFELWLRLTYLRYQAVSPSTCFAFRIHGSTTKVSSGQKMVSGFSYLVDYIGTLRSDPVSAAVIAANICPFLIYHCNWMAYRIVRSSGGRDLSVNGLVLRFKQFAIRLGVADMDFEKVTSIKLALMVDKFSLSRALYRWTKKVYAKPVRKSFF